MPFLFALTLALSAGLLFSVQPMIAKGLLPRFGGAPAVWTTCMVFFQAVLLAAYLYAYAMARWLGIRCQAMVHGFMLLLPLAFLPIEPVGWPAATAWLDGLAPSLNLLGRLLLASGVPFFLVATTAPLLQQWFATTRHRTAADPYFLYGASNLGSMLDLLAYPLLIEPRLSLTHQAGIWAVGYLGLMGLTGLCAILAVRGRGPDPDYPQQETDSWVGVPRNRWCRWVLLAFIPSTLLLGVTTYLSTDLAPVPLLWVIPLALYLLTFILSFAPHAIVPPLWTVRALPLEFMAIAFVLGLGLVRPELITLHLLTFFTAALFCHGELARDRPPSRDLTAFYLAIAFGGVLGGIFNALMAPILFDRITEYPMGLVLACLVVPAAVRPEGRSSWTQVSNLATPLAALGLTALAIKFDGRISGALAAMIASGLVSLVCWTHRRRPARFALTLGAVLMASGLTAGVNGRVRLQERSFFGVLQVTEDPRSQSHRLFHGRTLHGQQSLDPTRRREPLTYYTRSGPIGQVFNDLHARGESTIRSVAIVGLGAGTLACYARPGERWTFYEIDPAVVRIASDAREFTFLDQGRAAAAALTIVIGDARLKLDEARDRSYDLIVLDAFSSDAIPMHLLTREAVQVYRRKLTRQGVLAFHISNRSIELGSVLEALARDAGLVCRIRHDRSLTPDEVRAGAQGSIWAVLANRESDLGRLTADPRWVSPTSRNASVWTDDFASLTGHLILRFP